MHTYTHTKRQKTRNNKTTTCTVPSIAHTHTDIWRRKRCCSSTGRLEQPWKPSAASLQLQLPDSIAFDAITDIEYQRQQAAAGNMSLPNGEHPCLKGYRPQTSPRPRVSQSVRKLRFERSHWVPQASDTSGPCSFTRQHCNSHGLRRNGLDGLLS